MRLSILLAGVVLAALLPGCASSPPAGRDAAGEPGMLTIPGGNFSMGRDDGPMNERPAHKVYLDEFAIDRTEVAAGEFAEFLNAVGNDGEEYLTPNDYATVILTQQPDSARVTQFKARPGYERHPANSVSWSGADAYCRWRGKRLPTEAEWEKAARGTDSRIFPWGARKPGRGVAQFGQVWEENHLGVLAPVEATPEGASAYGALNMGGNVLEWVSDWYRQNLCDFCNPERESNLELIAQLTCQDASPPCTPGQAVAGRPEQDAPGTAEMLSQMPTRNNPRGPSKGVFKVLKGGSWQDYLEDDLAATRRFWLDPSQRFPHTGFRCAKGSERQRAKPPP